MDKELFEGLLTSVREAVAISKGEMKPSRIFRYSSDGTLVNMETSEFDKRPQHLSGKSTRKK